MKIVEPTFLALALSCVTVSQGDEVLFRDDFKGKLGEGWS